MRKTVENSTFGLYQFYTENASFLHPTTLKEHDILGREYPRPR